jgi:uncharacterized membrane protein
MLTSGGRARLAKQAAAAAALACALACALAASACGGQSDGAVAPAADDPAAADGLTTGPAAPQSVSQRTGAVSDSAAQPALITGPLDTSGWVLAPPFYAAGDEPFWKLDIIDGWFVFRRSGLAEIEAPLVQPTQAAGGDVFDTSPLKVIIKRQACQTEQGGHGDISAQVVFDEIEYGGCAFGGASAGASPEASAVVEALGPIDSCLAKLGEPALVTAVYPREGERTAVALRAKDGSLYECAAESDGQTIAFLDAIEQRAAGAWMSRMRFLRTGVADVGACADAEEVRAGDVVVGRLLTKACKF